jgi:thymidylate synthase (FAD)
MGQESGDGRVVGVETGFPFVTSPVFKTDKGTSYLRAPGVLLVSKPQTNLNAMSSFLSGFDPGLEFDDYLSDPDKLESGAQLIKFGGQACYASFSPKRSKNKDAQKYIDHIKESGHGSVLEHANYSLFFYGVSRSVTHELVRHRAGYAFSQLSQRYVSGKVLRFVERPEYQTDEVLHNWFVEDIDSAVEKYDRRAARLMERQTSGDTSLSADRKTDLRKKVNQSAREVLPNEVETFLLVTGNGRAWRHACEMRANEVADTGIRELFIRAFLCLRAVEPMLFNDYSIDALSDGTKALSTKFRKV